VSWSVGGVVSNPGPVAGAALAALATFDQYRGLLFFVAHRIPDVGDRGRCRGHASGNIHPLAAA